MPASSVKEVNVGSNLVPAMVSGRVDATLGGYWNYEAIQLAQMDKQPQRDPDGPGRRPDLRRAGAGRPQGHSSSISTNVIRRFVQALARGYEAVRKDPQAGVDNLVKANPGLDARLQLASVKATLPAFFPSDPNHPWGWQGASQWNAYGRWMLDNHLISNPQAVADASTNELLAGQGL